MAILNATCSIVGAGGLTANSLKAKIVQGFKRASTATYIDPTGTVQFVGNDVARLQNGVPLIEGTQFSYVGSPPAALNSYWGLISVTVTPTAITAPDGTTNNVALVAEVAATAQHMIQYNILPVRVIGQVYTMSVYAKAGINTQIAFDMAGRRPVFDLVAGTVVATGGLTCSIVPLANGWYLCSATETAINTAVAFYIACGGSFLSYAGTTGNGIYIWHVQIEDGTGSSLIPPSRNLIPGDASVITGFGWTSTGFTFTTASVAPDGTSTATHLMETSANAAHYTNHAIGTLQNGTVFTCSVYAKAAELTQVYLLQTGIVGGVVGFDLSAGTVIGSPVVPYSITPVSGGGGGWYRISATFTRTSTAQTGFYITTHSSFVSYVGIDNSGVLLWGPQVDIGGLTDYTLNAVRAVDIPAELTWPGAGSVNALAGIQKTVQSFKRATTGTYIDQNGVMQSAPINVARYNYDPSTLTPLGALVEEVVTNLIANPNTVNVGFNSVASSDIPRLYSPATLWKGTNPGTVSYNVAAVLGIPIVPGLSYAVSTWMYIPTAWAGGAPIINTDGSNAGTGAVSISGSADLSKRNQWQRVVTKITAGSTTTSFNLVIRQAAPFILGDVFYSTAWQVEQITTTSAPATTYTDVGTRAADIPAELTWPGAGNITALGTIQNVVKPIVFSGVGLVTTNLTHTPVGTATFTGAGTVTAAVTARMAAKANFPGAGTFTSAPVLLEAARAGIGGVGVVIASAAHTPNAAVAITGVGSVTASTTQKLLTSTILAGFGNVNAGTIRITSARAVLLGIGNVTANATHTPRIVANITGVATVVALATILSTVDRITLAGSGSVLSNATHTPLGTAALVGDASLFADVAAPLFLPSTDRTIQDYPSSRILNDGGNSRLIVDAPSSRIIV